MLYFVFNWPWEKLGFLRELYLSWLKCIPCVNWLNSSGANKENWPAILLRLLQGCHCLRRKPGGRSRLFYTRALPLLPRTRGESGRAARGPRLSHFQTRLPKKPPALTMPAWLPARAICPGWHRARLKLLWPSRSNMMMRFDEKSTDNYTDNSMSKGTL